VAPLEPWEKVLVDAETFPETVHGEIPCTDCHNGVQDADKKIAHTDLIARPSDGPDSSCAECHAEETAAHDSSLHHTQAGYWTVLASRGASAEEPAMQEMFGNHCASCHTTCGDCHISQPASVGGGLLDGHLFSAQASMSRTCTACHGSRVGEEYLGKHEDLRPDVHFRQGRMTCVDCHSGEQMHGQTAEPTEGVDPHRYAGPESPACQECHPTVGDDGNLYHETHGERLACQVCHSISYQNCEGCHVAVSEESGNPFFEVESHWLTFLIGRNPRQSEARPYDYVTVRHVPIDRDSFAFYGDNLLPEFDTQPTWRYATPHNIQRETPQTESCNACHGNPDLFLTADKVVEDELQANEAVIVDSVPAER